MTKYHSMTNPSLELDQKSKSAKGFDTENDLMLTEVVRAGRFDAHRHPIYADSIRKRGPLHSSRARGSVLESYTSTGIAQCGSSK